MKQVKRIARYVLLAAILFCYTTILSQELPKIIRPSPEASALFRYQDYPMDYSTGLPQISIPIYEVQSGSLSVPITISYHASGRKVYDQDGPVALGWSINTGGTISRTIYGSADFGTPTTGTYNFPFPFVTTGLSNLNDLVYLEKIAHYSNPDGNVMPWLDSEYDVFSYSIGSNSGKLIFKDSNGIKTPVLIPYKPFIVVPTYTSAGLGGIKITDDKGVVYEFSAGELYSPSSNSATSGWNLSKMISADKTDTISFTYTATSQERMTISQSAILIDNFNMQGEFFPTDNLTYPETTTHEGYTLSRITEIKFNQGKIVFNLGALNDKMNSIQVLNLNNEVLKTIQFSRSLCYSQSELGYATNKLDSLVFKDKSGNSIETYAFEYYPLVSSDGQLNPRYCDWWGYYNNSGVHDFVPRYTNLPYIGSSGASGTINIGNSSANRNPSLEPLKSGVLKKIIYPTGGNTEFIYEKNRCTLFGAAVTPVDGPGLRIYQIKSTESTGASIIKTYKYGQNESGSGIIDMLPDVTNMATEMKFGFIGITAFTPNRGGYYRQRTFSSGFIPELADVANRPVVYTEVTEYEGTETNNIGKTIYQYDYAGWGEAGMPGLTMTTIPKKHIASFNYWNTPSLLSKAEYKRTENAGGVYYQKRRETTNAYGSAVIETVMALHVQRNYTLPQFGRWGPGAGWYSEMYVINQTFPNPCSEFPGAVYTYGEYSIPIGYKNLIGTTVTDYNSDNSIVVNGVGYQYNAKQLINKTTTTASDGTSIVTDIKYPFDYTGNTLLDLMVSLNMLNYEVERVESKNAIHRKSTRTTYFNWGTTPARIASQIIDVKTGANAYEPRLRFQSYDASGNVISVSKENDRLVSYVYGYNNTLPIAEVMNAAVKNVFHTSFEDADGNSTLNDCKTGRRSRTNGYTKALSNLDNGSYILTYWKKSGGVWSLQVTAVTVSTGTYTISLTGQVDEVRFYPKTALMKTYTYDLLVGTLTIADEADRIQYYEYDDYSRLKLIRDQNGNIIKTIKYQYRGTTAN